MFKKSLRKKLRCVYGTIKDLLVKADVISTFHKNNNKVTIYSRQAVLVALYHDHAYIQRLFLFFLNANIFWFTHSINLKHATILCNMK